MRGIDQVLATGHHTDLQFPADREPRAVGPVVSWEQRALVAEAVAR